MLKGLGVFLFVSGLLLAVRVMFFGVQRRVDEVRVVHRKWPLALSGSLLLTGSLFYGRAVTGSGVTMPWVGLVAVVVAAVALAAWLFVHNSAAMPSTDPEDDPRFRFQGHVARVIEAIENRDGAAASGRISFEFENSPHVMAARWSTGDDGAGQTFVPVGEEVVIEFVENNVAYVEPWNVVEKRL